jgi:hypothetical protein
MTVQGVPTAVATTQLRQLLVELNKEGGKAAATFQDLSGKSFANFVRDGGSVQDALALMAEHAKDGNTSLSNLFGSVEAGNAALALTSESGAAAFNSALEDMQDSAGATDEAFGRMDEGIGRKWDKLKVRIDDLKLSLGEKLAPAIEGILDWFDQVTEGSDNFGEAMKRLGDSAETNIGGRVVPELEAFASDFQDSMVDNEGALEELSRVTGVLIGGQVVNWGLLSRAVVGGKDIVVLAFRGMIGVADLWARATLGAAEFAFGWIPGMRDRLKGLRERMKDFREGVNRELNKIQSRVNINVHTSFSTSGAPPTFIGGGGTKVIFGQHGGEVPGSFAGVDRVPAMLSAGEFVVRREVAQRHLPALTALNSGRSSAGGTVTIRVESGGTELDDAIQTIILRSLSTEPGFRAAVRAA